MTKKMNGYNGKAFASDVNNVKKNTLLETESSMILKPIMIGSYYKNGKQVRNIAYWMDVLNRGDAEALEKLQA